MKNYSYSLDLLAVVLGSGETAPRGCLHQAWLRRSPVVKI